MISLDEAMKMVLQEIPSENRTDMKNVVSLGKSHGRILASDVHSSCDLPPFRASIKDGYAVIADDGDGPRTVLGGIEAGHEVTNFSNIENPFEAHLFYLIELCDCD